MGLLTLMGEVAGGLMFLDRLTENPKMRAAKKNPKRRATRDEARAVFDKYASMATQAYKGYLIKSNAIEGLYFISKGGHHIGSTQAVPEAKKIIDSLTEHDANPKARKRKATKKKRTATRKPVKRKTLKRARVRSAPRRGRGKSARPVARPSQATRRKPTTRLLKRRRKTLDGPQGFYANPVKHGYDVTAGGARLATFATLTHAKEYGQAFADAHRARVKITKV